MQNINRVFSSSVYQRILKASTGTLGLRIVNSGLAFLTTILLTRNIGSEGYGIYAYSLAWLQISSLISVAGMEKVIVRYFATYAANEQWSLLRGFWRWVNCLAAILSLVMVSVAVTVFCYGTRTEMVTTTVLVLLGLPFLVLSKIRQAALQGMHHVVAGLLPEMALRPLLFLGMILLVLVAFPSSFTVSIAATLQVVAITFSFFFGVWQISRHYYRQARFIPPSYEPKQWISASLPLLLITAVTVLNGRLAILLLGHIVDAKAVGLFSVAEKGAELISFILFAVNASLAPEAARLHVKNDKAALQALVIRCSIIVIPLTFLVAIFFALFATPFLSFFGSEFIAAKSAFCILALGQFVNAVTGPVNLLLVMTGNEQYAARGTIISLFVNVIFCFLFIPSWGINGAATAVTLGMVTWNVIAARYVFIRLGISPTALLNFKAH